MIIEFNELPQTIQDWYNGNGDRAKILKIKRYVRAGAYVYWVQVKEYENPTWDEWTSNAGNWNWHVRYI
jgi:hypothetical protein